MALFCRGAPEAAVRRWLLGDTAARWTRASDEGAPEAAVRRRGVRSKPEAGRADAVTESSRRRDERQEMHDPNFLQSQNS